MIFKVERSSDCFGDTPKIESLNTLEEFLDFVAECQYPVIIKLRKNSKEKILEIYDAWRE